MKLPLAARARYSANCSPRDLTARTADAGPLFRWRAYSGSAVSRARRSGQADRVITRFITPLVASEPETPTRGGRSGPV
jgi:hypothetical protein